MQEQVTAKEALWRIQHALSFRIPIVNSLLFTALILKIIFRVPFSYYLFLLAPLLVLSVFGYDSIMRMIKNPNLSQIFNIYYIFLCLDAITFTFIIYFLGGVAWFGFIFYAFYFMVLFPLLPKNYVYLYFIYCTVLYSVLITGQFLEVFPYNNVFELKEPLQLKKSFVLTSLTAAVIILWALGYMGNFTVRLLREKIAKLQAIKIILIKEKASLETKVQKRTKELQEEREGLEEKVQERTEELQKERGELTERVEELETFHKLVVGRELKMSELKEEIGKLRKTKKPKK